MNKPLFFLGILIFLLSLAIAVPLYAQVEDTAPAEQTQGEGGGMLDGIFKAVGKAAQDSLEEGIEEFVGNYEGRIGEVKLLERRGNEIVLEVEYEKVKRRDGVSVQGGVMRWGEPLDGFSSTISPVQGKKGTVTLRIGRDQQAANDEWGSAAEAVKSDQIHLYLVRETNPERPFGSLVYDFPKTWTDSSEIETPAQNMEAEADSEETIELAAGETSEESDTVGAGAAVIRPGTTLKPLQTATAEKSAPRPASEAGGLTREVAVAAEKAEIRHAVSEYNFFARAGKAQWKSNAGPLPFPGSDNDRRGFARTLKNGVICPNNKAANLLQTHPQWEVGGWIQGRFPLMRLDRNVSFKSTGALLKDAETSDGVVMSVFVLEQGKNARRVLRKHITNRGYTPLEADLSAWAGKPVNIVLRVSAGRTSAQDWAVWVNPKLVKQ
ncbi:MAG: hypothetical protein KGY42_03205 [Desulfobacterales bacterium]|nr:hypothetical protein [Desulfobacterales bacterium]